MVDYVEDYRTKRRLADALLARSKAAQQVQRPSFDPKVTTAAQGAFPGMVQANIAAPIGEMIGAFLTARQQKKAEEASAAAESEASAAKTSAVTDVLANTVTDAVSGKRRSLSPTEVASLTELGYSPAAIKQMDVEEMNAAARAQAMATPQGRAALELSGELSKEENARITADEIRDAERKRQEEREDFENKQKITAKYREPRTPNELERYLKDPAGTLKAIGAIAAAKKVGKGGGDDDGTTGTGGAKLTPFQKIYGKEASKDQAKADVDLAGTYAQLATVSANLDKYIENDMVNPYTHGDMALALKAAAGITGIPEIAETSEEAQIETARASQFKDTLIQTLRGLGPASDKDREAVEGILFKATDKKKERTEKLALLKQKFDAAMKKAADAKARLKAAGVPGYGEEAAPAAARAPAGAKPSAARAPAARARDALDNEMDAMMGGGAPARRGGASGNF